MSAYKRPPITEKLKEVKYLNMSFELECKLEDMFKELEQEIQEIRAKHENHVRNEGRLLKPLFSKDPQVLRMKNIYDFFSAHHFFSQ